MSGHIPRSFIDELLTRCDIVELIDSRLPLRKVGSNYTACCPFHNEKSPSFTVSPNKQFYHCFGCGVNGNAISFLMAFEHLDFVAAIESLAAQLGLPVPYEASGYKTQLAGPDLYQVLAGIADYYQQQLRLSPTAIAYLKQRGLSGQIAKDYAIGYAPPGWENLVKIVGDAGQESLQAAGMLIPKERAGYYDRFRDRIMFPIRDRRGRVVGFGGRVLENGTPKYLNSPETAIFHKGKELYGLYEVLQAQRHPQRLLIVEGYMDVVMLAQHGIRCAVATLGTATTLDHIRQLLRVSSQLIFCFDGDTAGKAAAWRALQTCLPLLHEVPQIRFLLLPEGEDPDSQVSKEGSKAFQQRMARATPLADFLFEQLAVQSELNHVAGRAEYAKKAGQLIAKIPAGIFQHMLLEQLANRVQIDSHRLPSLLGLTTEQAPAATTTLVNPGLTSSLMRKVIALTLQYPTLIAQVNFKQLQLAEINLPGSDLLQQLVYLIQQQPDVTPAILLEHWRDQKEQAQHLAKLMSWQLDIPETGVIAEFEELVKRLQLRCQEEKIEQLYAKARQYPLSDIEKRNLQALIAALKMNH